MSGLLVRDAFNHHVWATLRLIDACADLDAVQLGAAAPGTYGSIIDTLRHLVGADTSYLYALTGGSVPEIEDEWMGVSDLRVAMESNATAWSSLLATELDPETIVVRHLDDGAESHAPRGIRLAQALHHGTDHRSQICTVLTTIGVEPPAIDVWDFADHEGRLEWIPPPT